MSEIEPGRFACDGCGKSYRWKPEIAGKKAKCKCGATMMVPAEDPAVAPLAPAEDGLDSLYDLAEDANAKQHAPVAAAGATCPGCGGQLAAGTVLCVACGYDLRSGKRLAAQAVGGGGAARGGAAVAAVPQALGYAGRAPARETASSDSQQMMMEYWVPTAAIFVGLVLTYMATSLPFKWAMPTIAISLFVNVVMLAIGCLAAVKMMDISLGSPGSAALKLAAIAIAPAAIGDLVNQYFTGSMGYFGWATSILLMYAMFHFFFDLDLGEILMLSAIIFVLQMFIGMMLVGVLLAALNLGTGVGGGGLGGGAPALAPSVRKMDAEMTETLKNTKRAPEAEGWLEESPSRCFGAEGGLPHVAAVKMVKGVYEAGAKKVHVLLPDGEYKSQADAVVIVMPKEADARKKIITYLEKNKSEFLIEAEELKDEAQKHLELSY